MNQPDPIYMPDIHPPLQWLGAPQHWSLDTANNLTITAGPITDWFNDPEGVKRTASAPALMFEVSVPSMLRARVTVDDQATFDAGVLVVYQSPLVWAKLCLERSPQGQLMVVSVVTRELSDDCNSVPIIGKSAYMRVAKRDHSFAFHFSTDGAMWHLVRHFALGSDSAPLKFGFLAQSPTGEGCTVRFDTIAYEERNLTDLRSGE
jgi:regulation of enolase protein 1 (concanavalin A-like superfamily)